MAEKKKVWIDTDVAIGMGDPQQGFADVDDAWAMVHLFKADHIEVIGVSTVFGNTDIYNATRIAKEMCERFGPAGLSVYQGAGEALDLDLMQADEAILALKAALEQEAMHIMAIGPATNVGKLLLLFPEVAEKILSVTLVAGRRSSQDHFVVGPQQAIPFRDLNFDLDPTAFQILLQTDIRINLLPFEISHKVWINQEDLGKVSLMGAAGEYLALKSVDWLKLWESFGCDAFNPFDILASAFLIDESGFGGGEQWVRIVIHENDVMSAKEQDIKHFKPYLLVSETDTSTRKVHYYHQPPENFKSDLFHYLAKS